ATSSALRAAGSFDQLLASFTHDAAKDVFTRYIYDGQGLLRFAIDALNRVTENMYWYGTAAAADGKIRETSAYARTLSALSDFSYSNVKTQVVSLASDSANRVSYFAYNSHGDLSYSVDAAGAVTGYAYDAGGRVTKTIQFAALLSMSGRPAETSWTNWL